MKRLLRLVVSLVSVLMWTTTLAQTPAKLEVIVFAGGFNWPLWVAQEKGFFREHGVEVRITPTPGSVYQLVNLIDGKFDIAMTAIDNLIAYREGQGEEPVPGPDLFAFMGGDNGFLRLVAVPDVKADGEKARRDPPLVAFRAAGRGEGLQSARQCDRCARRLPGIGGRSTQELGGREPRGGSGLHSRLFRGSGLALRPTQQGRG